MKAIITGGAIRVGKAIGLALAQAGYDIILIYNSSSTEAENSAAEIKQLGRDCHLYKCDLNSKKNIDSVFKTIFEKHDEIKLLVNNASIFERHNFYATDEDIFDRHFNINFKAPFFITQVFGNYIKTKNHQGHVVNLLDSLQTKNTGTHFAYLLSKKALLDFTVMAAKNLGPDLRVNAISIGVLLPAPGFDEEWMREKTASMPLQRKVELSDITNGIIYLDNAKSLTGQNIYLDSGWHL